MFQLFQDKADIFFHLPQSLSPIYFDGAGILEASMAFIIVKRRRGYFCSFCAGKKYNITNTHTHTQFPKKFPFILCFQLSHFYVFLLIFLFYSPSSCYPFPSSLKALCYTLCLTMGLLKFSLSIVFSPNLNFNFYAILFLNLTPH